VPSAEKRLDDDLRQRTVRSLGRRQAAGGYSGNFRHNRSTSVLIVASAASSSGVRSAPRDQLTDDVHFGLAHAASGDGRVPTRIPLATIGGFWSKGIAFLFTVMPALPSAASATLP
jgi:hypothetical protein